MMEPRLPHGGFGRFSRQVWGAESQTAGDLAGRFANVRLTVYLSMAGFVRKESLCDIRKAVRQ